MTATAPGRLPADTDERRRIVTDLGTTLFVEAGAGTGKTTALVDRVTNLVATGQVALANVAAITFTEAAAAELRERIRLSLERGARDRARTSEERARCAAALDEVDEAALQTLHGFANRILSAHAVEAGLPPGFTVRDATEVQVAFDARWTSFLRALQVQPAFGPPLRAAVALGLTVDHLHDVARALHDAWDLAEKAALSAPGSLDGITDRLEQAMDEVVALRGGCAVTGDPMAEAIDRRLVPWWGAVQAGVAAAGDDPAVVAAALEPPAPKLGSLGRAPNWNVSVAEVRTAAKAVAAAHEEARRAVRQHLLEALLPAIVAFTVGGAEERRRDGVLEYHDLLVRARRLLRADPSVRAAVGRRHQAILVDEFQDTDPLQVDLAVLACTSAVGPIPEEQPWNELPVAAGRLFFVGDPKQSIYRFRRADIDLYARVRDGLGGALAPLVSSFRSTPAVVDAVNAAFGPWFARQGEGQAPWRDLVAQRDAAGHDGSVAVLGGIQHRMPAQLAREAAAADVVRCVQLALERGWPVFDVRDREWRSARADDITVLLPTRTALPALERAFEDASLPYRVEARSLVWSTQEVRDLLSVLRAVADPGDEVAAAAALLSGVLSCSHEDLRTWRAAGGSWDHGQPRPDGIDHAHPVADAMRCLGRWAGEAPWATPAGLLDRIVRERAVLEAAFAQPRQREAWHRVRFLAEQARSCAAPGTSALRAFVDWADRQADEQAQALESVVPEPDDHAVRVLTIHSAKGLEFPITIVAGLNVPRGGAVTPPTRVLWGRDGRIELSCGARERGFRTAGFGDLADREQVRAEQEQTRLLYVACTRARDHLVVCAHRTGSTRDESSAAADIATWMADVPGVATTLEELEGLPGLGRLPASADPPPASAGDTPRSPAGWSEQRRAALAAAARPAALPATAVADLDDPDAIPTLPLGLGLGGPARAADDREGVANESSVAGDGEAGGLAPLRSEGRGTGFGRAVHAVLEHAALGAPLDAAALAVASAAAAGEQVDVDDVVATAAAAVGAPAALSAGAAGRSWREAFVAAEIEGIVVEGFVDLLWEDAAGLHVVDWKTDRVASAAARRAKAGRYALQLATYAVALEHVAGRPVVDLTLVFCGPGSRGPGEVAQEVVRGAALDEAKAAVRSRLAGVASPS